MRDYITAGNLVKLRLELQKLGYYDEESERAYLPIPHVPYSEHIDWDDKEYTISLVRSRSAEDEDILEYLVEHSAIQLVGECDMETAEGGIATYTESSEPSKYTFYDPDLMDLYERLRKVGVHRELILVRDEDGNPILDKDKNTVKEPTSHSYMHGVFF